jgi:hypothetical protein
MYRSLTLGQVVIMGFSSVGGKQDGWIVFHVDIMTFKG